MIIDTKFTRAYTMTPAAAIKIVTVDVPLTRPVLGTQAADTKPACFWCGKEDDGVSTHFYDCPYFVAERVLELTGTKVLTGDEA